MQRRCPVVTDLPFVVGARRVRLEEVRRAVEIETGQQARNAERAPAVALRIALLQTCRTGRNKTNENAEISDPERRTKKRGFRFEPEHFHQQLLRDIRQKPFKLNQHG